MQEGCASPFLPSLFPDSPPETDTADLMLSDEMCPDCKNPNGSFVEDFASGDVICTECGLVVGDRIVDTRSEWRSFSDDSGPDPSRASRVDDWLPSGGLATGIAQQPPPNTAQGAPARGANNKMLTVLSSRVQSSPEDRNLLKGFEKIAHIADQLNIPQRIQNKAKELFSSFEKHRTKSQRLKVEALAAAIVFVACKLEKLPRTFKEISSRTQIPFSDIRKAYGRLDKALPKSTTSRTTVSAADLVIPFCSMLKLSQRTVNLAMHIAGKGAPFLEGKKPSSIAAASILMATTLGGEKKDEKDIMAAASINSLTTLRKVYKELQPHKASVLPGDYQN